MTDGVLLGVDGGATKTEVVLLDQSGNYLSGIFGGPTMLDARCSKQISQNLDALISHVTDQAGVKREQIIQAGFGLHGVDYKTELAVQRRTLFKPLGLPLEKSILVNDGIVALWGGSAKKNALVLQIGTGFTAAYRRDYGSETPFDHFNMGLGINLRDAIYSTAFRVLDGRERPSILPELVMEHFGIYDVEEVIRKWRREQIPIMEVLGIVTVLVQAVDKKDKVAIRLTERAAREYANDICTMIKKIGSPQPDIVLGGGVLLNAPKLLRDLIAKKVRARYKKAAVHTPHLSPAAGGAVMAAFFAGLAPQKVFRQAKRTMP